VAAAGADRWEFSMLRGGPARWLGLRGTIVIAGSNRGRLSVGPLFRSGQLLLAATLPILWERGSGGAGRGSFVALTGESLVTFESTPIPGAASTHVDLEPAGAALSYHYLLITLGCYLTLLGRGGFR
jgi:hypothetical protein